METKWYDYLILYSFQKEGYLTPCRGNIEVSRINKINSFTSVHCVKDLIESKIPGAKNILIENIMYLGRNVHE